MSPSKLPPFSSLLKSRDVEDPVNIWMHRPLAYSIVALIYRTSITPNQITLLATLVGVAAGVCWFVAGSSGALVVLGGALLWSSSILDGADGILARAKKTQSEMGRALDGAGDTVVAVVTVNAAFYHIGTHIRWEPIYLPYMIVALVTAVIQIVMYDFYKESYLQSTNPGWDGRTVALEEAREKLRQRKEQGASVAVLLALKNYVDMMTLSARLATLTNPLASRTDRRFSVSEETVQIYRKHNYWPMQLWSLVSLCPHTYMMAICALFNRLDLYLLYRVFGGNAIWLTAIVWQRIATKRTLRELEEIGAAPELLPTSEPRPSRA